MLSQVLLSAMYTYTYIINFKQYENELSIVIPNSQNVKQKCGFR